MKKRYHVRFAGAVGPEVVTVTREGRKLAIKLHRRPSAMNPKGEVNGAGPLFPVVWEPGSNGWWKTVFEASDLSDVQVGESLRLILEASFEGGVGDLTSVG